MRYAVLSDIHGNLEALRAVLADCAGQVDGVLCLGDLVGYGADPAACVELVAERAELLVAGNHEYGVTGQLALEWFNPLARAAAEWTAGTLADDQRTRLAGLPLTARLGEATLGHASPRRPDAWEDVLTAADRFAPLAAFRTAPAVGPRSPRLRPRRAAGGGPRPPPRRRRAPPPPPGLRRGGARRARLLPRPPPLARPHVPPLQRGPVAGHVAADRGPGRLLWSLLRGGGPRAPLARAPPRPGPPPPVGGAPRDPGPVAPPPARRRPSRG